MILWYVQGDFREISGRTEGEPGVNQGCAQGEFEENPGGTRGGGTREEFGKNSGKGWSWYRESAYFA